MIKSKKDFFRLILQTCFADFFRLKKYNSFSLNSFHLPTTHTHHLMQKAPQPKSSASHKQEVIAPVYSPRTTYNHIRSSGTFISHYAKSHHNFFRRGATCRFNAQFRSLYHQVISTSPPHLFTKL